MGHMATEPTPVYISDHPLVGSTDALTRVDSTKTEGIGSQTWEFRCLVSDSQYRNFASNGILLSNGCLLFKL